MQGNVLPLRRLAHLSLGRSRISEANHGKGNRRRMVEVRSQKGQTPQSSIWPLRSTNDWVQIWVCVHSSRWMSLDVSKRMRLTVPAGFCGRHAEHSIVDRFCKIAAGNVARMRRQGCTRLNLVNPACPRSRRPVRGSFGLKAGITHFKLLVLFADATSTKNQD